MLDFPFAIQEREKKFVHPVKRPPHLRSKASELYSICYPCTVHVHSVAHMYNWGELVCRDTIVLVTLNFYKFALELL